MKALMDTWGRVSDARGGMIRQDAWRGRSDGVPAKLTEKLEGKKEEVKPDGAEEGSNQQTWNRGEELLNR
jgi:hypothetical protein